MRRLATHGVIVTPSELIKGSMNMTITVTIRAQR
jgi:hypothetical protein